MRTRGAWQHRGREGTAPDGDALAFGSSKARWYALGSASSPAAGTAERHASSQVAVVLRKPAIVDGERDTEAAESHLFHLRYLLLICRRRFHLGQLVFARGRSAALRVAARGQRRPHWTITSRVLWCRPIDGCEATWHSQSCGGKKLRGIAIRRTQEAECAPRKQPSSDAELSPSPRAQSSACWRVRAHLLAPDSGGERQMGGKAGADKHRDLGLRRRAHAPRPTG